MTLSLPLYFTLMAGISLAAAGSIPLSWAVNAANSVEGQDRLRQIFVNNAGFSALVQRKITIFAPIVRLPLLLQDYYAHCHLFQDNPFTQITAVHCAFWALVTYAGVLWCSVRMGLHITMVGGSSMRELSRQINSLLFVQVINSLLFF